MTLLRRFDAPRSHSAPAELRPLSPPRYASAELAGHAHKLDVKLQSLCGSGFSLFAVRMLAANVTTLE